MSCFIEIKSGLSVRKEDVESVERLSNDGFQDNGSTVNMKSGKSHESTFPYINLLQLLEVHKEGSNQDSMPVEITEKLNAVLDKQTFLAS